ncbi:MAG: hypothetical protein Q9194_000055 [Teloschistes cf. exilis]
MSPSPAPHSPPHENASRDQPVQPSVPAKTDLVEMKRIVRDPITLHSRSDREPSRVNADIEIASKDHLQAKIATLETRIDETRLKLDHATAKLNLSGRALVCFVGHRIHESVLVSSALSPHQVDLMHVSKPKNLVPHPIDPRAFFRHPDPNQTVDHHIKLLRQYNDVRDIATGLMGIMAEHRQLPMKRIYQDLGLDEKD